MSIEISNIEGDKFRFSHVYLFDQNSQNIGRGVDIGPEEVSSKDFFNGIVKFLDGHKDITIGSTKIQIPDSVDGSVVLGEQIFPYPEFVWLIMHGIQFWSGEKYNDENLTSFEIRQHSLNALEEKLLSQLPQRADQD